MKPPNDIAEFNAYLMAGAKDPVITTEPVIDYVIKSPGKPVRFANGKIVSMNRAARRRNKIK